MFQGLKERWKVFVDNMGIDAPVSDTPQTEIRSAGIRSRVGGSFPDTTKPEMVFKTERPIDVSTAVEFFVLGVKATSPDYNGMSDYAILEKFRGRFMEALKTNKNG